MLTEEEAKKKWCPHVRLDNDTGNGDGVTYNRVSDNDPKWKGYPDTRCIASECMAWRWEDHQRSRSGEGSKGHCGLSGNV